jgi:AcrR family transcriptional regulator
MPPATSTRRERERDIVDATRALFDERGLQDAPIEDIARAVGINKALIYRVFASKEELFVLTVTTYLDELRGLAADTDDLRGALDAFTRFCLRYPAFLDCALSLMRRPAGELEERVGEGTWLRLGRSMSACLAPLAAILEAEGAEDPDFTANRLYTQVLGTMHLARVGLGVREAAPGVPDAFPLDPERVRAACVDDALALVRSASAAPRASTPPAAAPPPARA